MAHMTHNGIGFDTDTDYKKLENEALAKGDRLGAARYEMQRNAKIDSLGLGDKWAKENKYGIYDDNGVSTLTWDDLNTDYMARRNEFVRHGDYDAAALAEQMHNKKNNVLGLGYANTNAHDYFLENPVYKNEYQSQMNSLLGDMGEAKFEFYPKNNAAWKSIEAQHNREAERATEDAMGAYAAMTGGIPSSYAVSAAAQAGANERAKATDRLADIYEAEYNRYLAELENKQRMFNNYATLDERDYGRYIDERGFEYDAARDRTGDEKWQAEHDLNIQRERNDMDTWRTEHDFNVQKQQTDEQQWKAGHELDVQKEKNDMDAWQAEHDLNVKIEENDNNQWEKEFDHNVGLDNHQKDLDILETYISINDIAGIKKWFEDRGLAVPENVQTADMMDYAIAQLNKGGGSYLVGKIANETAAAAPASSPYSPPVHNTVDGARYYPQQGTGQPEGDEQSSAMSGKDIVDKAVANGGVVTDPKEWEALTSQYGEDALREKGFTFVPEV